MSSYTGKHAEYYDIFYQDKPYAQEARFVHDRIQKHSMGTTKRLLELACGPGKHALELEKLGYQIVATDYSEDLLAVAKAKAAAAGSAVEFRFQDMRDLELAGAPFDAVYCLFDSIGYVQNNDAIQQVLGGVHRHLRTDGIFVFEFWHAAAMLRSYDPVRQREWKINGGVIKRTSTTRLDVSHQLAEVTYDIHEYDEAGKEINHLQETQVNRYFLVQEMDSYLRQGQFEPLEFLPAYETHDKIDETTWHILAVARKQ